MSEHPSLLFRWRWAIASEHGPSNATTRLVLLTLSLHMDLDGDRGFPATRLLEKETGLSERCVIAHLALANSLGWLRKASAGKNGQGWRKHKYEPLIPLNAVTEGNHEPGGQEGKVLKEGKHQGTEPRSARYEKGAYPHAKGAYPDDKKVLNQVQSNSTVNSTNNSTHTRGVCAFDLFLEEYPRKEAIEEARRIWKRHKLDDQLPAILQDLKARKARYEPWQREGGRYIPFPARYLMRHAWHDKWAPSPRRSEYVPMRPRPKEAAQ